MRSRVRVAHYFKPRGIDFEAGFTGVSAPYEAPEKPELHIKTDEVDVMDAVRVIMQYLTEHGYIV